MVHAHDSYNESHDLSHMTSTHTLQLLLTTVKAGLKVWVGPVLHQHALGLLRVEGDFGGLGADQRHEVCCVLVLLPVVRGQVVVGVGTVEEEAFILGGRLVKTAR